MIFRNKVPVLFALAAVVLHSSLIQTEAANILFFIGFGGPSHRIAMDSLANSLVDKGHNVTFLVQEIPNRSDGSKINYYSPKKLTEHFEKLNANGGTDFYSLRTSGFSSITALYVQTFGILICEQLYSDPAYLQWMNETKFDLVIVDALFNECGYGIAHMHGAKTMIFSVSSVLSWTVESIGYPDETSFVPDTMLGFAPGMSFFERTATAIMPIFWRVLRQIYYMPKLTSITKNGLQLESFPSFSELERNVSLVLLNTHPSFEYPRSLPPNVIPVGGMSWVEKNKKKPLPKKFVDFINAGKEGFVYVSFGSFLDFLSFPLDVQERFVNTFRKFPNIQFIWKLNKVPENLPPNVLVEKWLPQQEILYHPKIRLFITHAGIGGVNEAIYTSVPLILFPIFTEQDYNAHLIESKGCGIKMEITALTESAFEAAIQNVLTDEKYKTNMKKLTEQFLDRPMKPVDSAVWWTEYVLRQDTDFLRPHNVQQSWWVKRQFDVWLFILLVNSCLFYLSYKLAKILVKKCCCTSKKVISKKIKKN